ncbi:DUF1302 domain-containing protein [Iodobacter ciconiae]|uniref:DUF1302 family protein n=1 Tax=Iodobacter ciconiae TaxID=2496266 RepID=A0A3S8ZX32_9NEIS|nr:DUF1302 family protein [Iodobacter ciconiae]AZN38018.1 DUF1302 family protein [Iodobacter ciconiae]
MKLKQIGSHRCLAILLYNVLIFSPGAAQAGELVFGNVRPALGEGIELDLKEAKIEWKGALGISTVIRAESPDALLTNGRGMSTHDDGDLNYERGDMISQVLDAYLQAKLSAGDYGMLISAKAWYDHAPLNHAVPHGNVSNNYKASALNDSGFAPLSQFSGALLHDAYLYGHFTVMQKSLELRAGQQVIPWRTPTTILGGIQQVNALDFASLRRGNPQPETMSIPVPALYARLKMDEQLSLDAYYQFDFLPNAYPGCGTFYSSNDYAQAGCNKLTLNGAMLGVINRKAISTNDQQSSVNPLDYIARTTDLIPNEEQFGVSVTYKPTETSTLGVFYAHYTSRNAIIQALRTGPGPFLTNPVNGEPVSIAGEYRQAYLAHRHLWGINLSQRLMGGSGLYLEYSYRPNQPLPWNGTDFLNGFLVGIGPLKHLASTAAGYIAQGYDDFPISQWIIGARTPLPPLLGNNATLAGEIGIRHVGNLPSTYERRYGRSGFGMAPSSVAPACSGPKTTCALEGFITPDAWGWRLKYENDYHPQTSSWIFRPSLSLAYDMAGYSEDGQFSEGRYVSILGIGAIFQKNHQLDFRYIKTGGGEYNLQRDRSSFILSARTSF